MTKMLDGNIMSDGQYALECIKPGGLAVSIDNQLWIKYDMRFTGIPPDQCWYNFGAMLPFPGLNRRSASITSEELWNTYKAKPLYSIL